MGDFVKDKDDLISRQAAIESVFQKPAWHGSDGSYFNFSDIEDAINSLPSAQRKGKIIIRSNMLDGEDCYCSKCDHWGLLPNYEFCPYCGVAFEGVITEGEEDENNNQI